MSEPSSIFVNGYRFETEEDAEIARQEMKKAAYFTEKLEGRNAESILTVYDKLLDEKVFITPIGWEYMKRLQQGLKQDGIAEDVIRPVPLYQHFSQRDKETEFKPVKQRIRPSQKNTIKLRNGMRISVLVNILLALMVIAMFVITIKSDNPNILNYKRALEDKYAAWEQDLSEREAVIREKENEISQK